MRISKISTFLIVMTAFACPSQWLAAQEAADNELEADELETIDLDEVRQAKPQPDDGLDSIEFDEATQSYRLVVDEEGDDYVEPPSERETQFVELQRLFDLYREALNNKAYLEADTLAKRVVELSIRLNGIDSHDSAKAITNLGIAQHNNGDFESALRNFRASIDIIERIDDNLSNALINPLQGLAATHAAVGRPDLARLAYQRAVHVSHVNEGPHNEDQVGILASMAELHISQGDFDEATDIQERVFSIQSRNIDPLSLEMIPALEKRASWQHRLQQYHGERVTWRQIINIMQRHYGKNGLELISPLTNLGKSYLFVSPAEFEYQPEVSTSSGESYLRRAYRIAEAHPDSDWRLIENTMLSLGDYYILSGRPNRGSKTYQETWEFLSEGDDPDRLLARRDHLEKIKVLQRVFPPKNYNSQRDDTDKPPPEDFATGTMSFTYVVSPSGRVVNLKHLETQPREIMDFDKVVGRSLRRMIYRPRMQNGVLVATGDVIYTHEFFYRPSELPKLQPTDTEPPAAEPVTQDDTPQE